MTGAAAGYWQRTRRLAVWLVLAWIVLVLLLPQAAAQLEVIAVMGIPLGYYASAQGLLIALVIAAFWFAYRQRRIDGRYLYGGLHPPGVSPTQPMARKGGLPGMAGALAMATDWLSGAVLIGMAGTLYTFGHDGLTWLLGLCGGIVLGGALVGPHLHRGNSAGSIEFITQRFGTIVGTLALLAAAMATALLLAANMQAFVKAASVLVPDMPWSREGAVLFAATVFVVAASRAGPLAGSKVQALVYPLLFAALIMPLALIALASSGAAPNQLTYGTTLQAISAAELRLLEQGLADPVTLKAYLRPFTTATISSSILLALSLALGLAAMPHITRRPALARSYEGARLMPATALLLVLVAVLALPPLAALARQAVLISMAGSKAASLPATVFEIGRLGLIDICGAPARTQEATVAACAALPDAPQELRLDDIGIAPDSVLLASPVLAGLPVLTTLVLAIAVAAASLFAVAWLGVTLGSANAGGHRSGWWRLAATVTALAAAVGAVLLALSRTAETTTLIAWGLGLAAAGLAPVVLVGIWWVRATPVAAALAVLSGLAITCYYIIATRYFAPQFYELWSAISSAGYGAIADYDAAKQALSETTEADLPAARQALHEAARAVANWWGLRNVAAGALGAFVGLVVIAVVSLITPRPGADAVSLISRIRGLTSRV